MFEGHHYQNAYICDDIEAAIGMFRARGHDGQIRVIETSQPVDTPQGEVVMSNRLAFAWVGDMQYELIQPVSDPLGLYANAPSNGGPLRFHHICMRINDWDDFRTRASRQDLPIVIEGGSGDRLKFLYLDARKVIGHYLEYTWMTDAQWDQIRRI